MPNDAAQWVTALVADPAAAAEVAAGNVLRLVLHPDGLRPVVANFDEVAAALLRRLEREVAHAPHDTELAELLDWARRVPGVGALGAQPAPPDPTTCWSRLHLRATGADPATHGGDIDLRLFTTITTIGAGYDVTLEELRIETLLPADAATEDALQRLAVSYEPEPAGAGSSGS